jgi:DNA-directed RNA polymerase subunit N (RpoN/RPB10)
LVFTVRCFKCGEKDVRLIMGGRSIIHARCHDCGANLLADVMEFEQEAMGVTDNAPPDEPATSSGAATLDQESSSTLEEDTQARQQS